MKRIFKSVFVSFFALFASLFFVFASFASAADLTVTCDGTCSISPDEPIFDEQNIYPGYSATYNLTAKNNNSDTCTFMFSLADYNQTGGLGDVINLYIEESGTPLYSGLISALSGGGWQSLSDIGPSLLKVYQFTAEMDTGADNQYQGRELTFDVNLRFECPGVSPSPSPTAAPSSSPSDGEGTTGTSSTTGTGDSSGGAGGGDDSSLLTAALAPFRAVLPRVRGVTAEEAPPETPAEVAGVEEEEGPGEVAGIVCPWWKYPWWVPLVIQAALTIIYYHWENKREKEKKINAWWFVPVFLALLSQLVHEILGCECVESKWCPWYWLFNLLILLVTTSYFRLRKKEVSSDLT